MRATYKNMGVPVDPQLLLKKPLTHILLEALGLPPRADQLAIENFYPEGIEPLQAIKLLKRLREEMKKDPDIYEPIVEFAVKHKLGKRAPDALINFLASFFVFPVLRWQVLNDLNNYLKRHNVDILERKLKEYLIKPQELKKELRAKKFSPKRIERLKKTLKRFGLPKFSPIIEEVFKGHYKVADPAKIFHEQYKEFKKFWKDQEVTKNMLRKIFKEVGIGEKDKILVLGAGQQDYFPEEYMKNAIAVDIYGGFFKEGHWKGAKQEVMDMMEALRKYENDKSVKAVVAINSLSWLAHLEPFRYYSALRLLEKYRRRGATLILADPVRERGKDVYGIEGERIEIGKRAVPKEIWIEGVVARPRGAAWRARRLPAAKVPGSNPGGAAHKKRGL